MFHELQLGMLTPPDAINVVESTIVKQVESYFITNAYYNSNLHIISSSTTSQNDHMKLLLHSLFAHKNCVEENSTIETKQIKVNDRELWITSCSCSVSSLVSLGHAYRWGKVFLLSSHHHKNNCKLATSQDVKNHDHYNTNSDAKSIS